MYAMRILQRIFPLGLALLLFMQPGPAAAHASDQAFVLLLPTGVYTISGLLCVGLTLVLVILIPDQSVSGWSRSRQIREADNTGLRRLTSLLSTSVLGALVWEGFYGSRDPTANLMPLSFWVAFWVGFVTIQGLLGNLWRWVNPWEGLASLFRLGRKPVFQVPSYLGYWPSVGMFFAFGGFLLADPAPSDPARLAAIVLTYWLAILAGVALFGRKWIQRCEFVGVFLMHFARLSAIRYVRQGTRIGWPGWQIVANRRLPVPFAVMPLMMLAVGSFDGLNETFWWFDRIGINPFLYPGRSGVVLQSLSGLAAAVVALYFLFWLALWSGKRLAGDAESTMRLLAVYGATVLPIAFGYHVAHYLPGFLVDVQYLVLAFVRLFGGEEFYVTTSFFYDRTTVQIMWLTQAGFVVTGHVFAIVLAHVAALRLYGNTRQAVLSQIPLGVFMMAYTLFGLWLLAAPRGA